MFGSYNKFHNKINIDAAVVSSLDFLTSLIASCVIFSVLGFLAKEFGVEVDKVADGGQGEDGDDHLIIIAQRRRALLSSTNPSLTLLFYQKIIKHEIPGKLFENCGYCPLPC